VHKRRFKIDVDSLSGLQLSSGNNNAHMMVGTCDYATQEMTRNAAAITAISAGGDDDDKGLR
jgi:hypothetical protein